MCEERLASKPSVPCTLGHRSPRPEAEPANTALSNAYLCTNCYVWDNAVGRQKRRTLAGVPQLLLPGCPRWPADEGLPWPHRYPPPCEALLTSELGQGREVSCRPFNLNLKRSHHCPPAPLPPSRTPGPASGPLHQRSEDRRQRHPLQKPQEGHLMLVVKVQVLLFAF